MTSAIRHILLADAGDALAPALRTIAPVTRTETSAEALRSARTVRPSVVVVHSDVPPEGGVALLARLAPLRLPLALAVGETADDGYLVAALRAGVGTFVAATAPPDRLARALTAAVCGELFVSTRLLGQLTALLDDEANRYPFPALSTREREVLTQLAGGADSGRIAARLGLTPKTVRNHLGRIQTKLGANDRAQAAVIARAAGLARRTPHDERPD